MTRDQLRLLARDNVVSDGADTLSDLGIEPTAYEGIAPGVPRAFPTGGQVGGLTARHISMGPEGP